MGRQKNIRYMIQAGVLCAVICVLALVVVPIGPVPFSLSILAVALTGALLPPVWALGSVAAYLLLGLFGLPVFAGFSAGPGVLFGPTGGYLMGYFLLVASASLVRKRTLPIRLLFTTVGLLLCYIVGTIWFVLITRMDLIQALWVCVIPFCIPDLLKIAVATLAATAVERQLQAQNARG